MRSKILFIAVAIAVAANSGQAQAQSQGGAQYDGIADSPQYPLHPLEDHVLKAERAWNDVASHDYKPAERAKLSHAFEKLQNAARDCDHNLVTAQAKQNDAARLGQKCKEEWQSAKTRLASEIKAANLDFGVLPPEVNSGSIYAGARSGAMLEASGAWVGLAGELQAAEASFELQSQTLGNSKWQLQAHGQDELSSAVHALDKEQGEALDRLKQRGK